MKHTIILLSLLFLTACAPSERKKRAYFVHDCLSMGMTFQKCTFLLAQDIKQRKAIANAEAFATGMAAASIAINSGNGWRR